MTKYDVERIMASNTLLAGEVARRNKDIGSTDKANASTNSGITLPISTLDNNQGEANWKMALYQSPQPHQLDQKGEFDSNKSHGFSLAHDLSNASSLVTSLSSSKEGSPDRTSVPMMFPMPTSKLLTGGDNNVNVSSSWIPTPQLRPSAMSMPQMPEFYCLD